MAAQSTRIPAPACERAVAQQAHADLNLPQSPPASIAQAKARQSKKIRELRLALQSAGLHSLDQHAGALGLCRSTAWKILQGDHKASGLSAVAAQRMLPAPNLSP